VINARRFALPLAAALSLAALGACDSGKEAAKQEATQAPEGKPGISVADGKLILPAVSGNPGAAYFALDNEGTGTVSIAAIAIDGVGKTEVHQTIGGQMKPVDRIDVEAKTVIKFERGGLHVMAFELGDQLKAGETTEMTVTFADGDKVSAPLKIEAMGADAMGGMDHGEGH
jgi:periplasmic copper chaperone A